MEDRGWRIENRLDGRSKEEITMKLGLFAAIMLFAGCASSTPYSSAPNTRSTTTGSSTSSTTSTYSRDVVDCERKAAAADSGSKGKALDSCLKARGHTPGR
jgi:uncharacterized lipoprotein YajG